MTLSEQTSNTTLNIPHGVRRSDFPLLPPPPTFRFVCLCCLASSFRRHIFFAPTSCGCVGALLPRWGSVAHGPPFYLCMSFSCVVRLGSCSLCRPLSFVWFFDPFWASPHWALGVSVWCFCLCVLWCFSVSVALLSVYCWAPLFLLCFLAVVGSSPCLMLLPLPPRLVLCGALAQFFTLVPPSGYLVAAVTAWLPCFTAGSVVVLCRPSFILSHGSKGFWPCVGFVLPSPPCCMCCLDALFDHTEVFIWMMIQVPHWSPLSCTIESLLLF